jgi:Sulfotransferase family
MSQDASKSSVTGPDARTAPGPLFIVSMWRAGSSLLYALLNKHPQVAVTFEADLWLLRSVFRKPTGHREWAERWEFWNLAFSRHGMTVDDLPRGIRDYRAAFTAFHRAYALRKGATIWGDKSPNYYDSLSALARLFPKARFIVVWRDPMATANAVARGAQVGSHFHQRRGGQLRGLIGNQILKSEVDHLLSIGQPICQVTYEALTSNTAKVMEEICRFLDIPYSDQLADLRDADRSAISDGEHHAMVRGDKIVDTPRAVVLDGATQRKVAGYVNLWKRRHGGDWPQSALAGAGEAEPPQLWQEFGDNVAYRAFRGFDEFRQVAFCCAPLSLLQGYRAWRRRQLLPAGSEPAKQTKS